ncbi:acyltransferase family protein [Undibacterium sp. Di26W]|uniref:acyltransferase family protein n=1 Tax=Undibacterium sp. Di26W TaxID=3413035 RepID=UPI003BEFC6AE
MNTNQRLHSLDNLRAIMMWLGIVVHVSVNYMESPAPTPWRDSQTSLLADLLIVFIHAFRMPVFFILAGFFVAMLVARRGIAAMLQQRVRKLVWPFMLFWPVLFIGMALLMAVYAHLNAYGTIGVDFSLIPQIPGRAKVSLLHLWFIYYLFLYCLVYALLLRLSANIPSGWQEGLARSWKILGTNWWGILLLSLPLAVAGGFYRNGMVIPLGSFLPDIAEFIHSGLFFTFGIFLDRYQSEILENFTRKSWLYLIAGLPVFFLFLKLSKSFGSAESTGYGLQWAMAYLYNGVSWLWSFALIGLFLRYLPGRNRVLTYMADSSYWVYLVHMLGTMGFGILLYHSPFGAIGRMICNILLTTLFCLLSYHLLIRHRFMGRFLNGSTKKTTAGPDAEAMHSNLGAQ